MTAAGAVAEQTVAERTVAEGATLGTVTVETATATVAVPASGTVEDLLGGLGRREVFTTDEARRCASRPGLTGWAGRYAAKLAVARLLGTTELAGIEILPDASGCADGTCTASHPPAVRLAPGPSRRLRPGQNVEVTITHTRRLAVAVAVVSGRGTAVPDLGEDEG